MEKILEDTKGISGQVFVESHSWKVQDTNKDSLKEKVWMSSNVFLSYYKSYYIY